MSLIGKSQIHLLAFVLLVFASNYTVVAQSTAFDDYHNRVKQCVNALDTLAAIDESEDEYSYDARVAETIQRVLSTLPATEKVSWDEGDLSVDNKWVHDGLGGHEKAAEPARREGIRSVAERLKAVDERLEEVKQSNKGELTRAATASRIKEILARPEYDQLERQESALAKLWRDFVKWLQQLIPKPQPLSPGSASLFTQLAKIVVLVLALAVIVYVLRTFAPTLLRRRRQVKKRKSQACVVLGETLTPDQSALDLLNEAEALARQGDIRAAIRKAYIALLVELGDRKVLSLAQHKTNRDYLRAVRETKPLYENMKSLTDSFEQHWYGLAHASEADWANFRAAYHKALAA
ncbi:MAG TPA: DUF4129 domain-containing protein [Pyrinomonadaceae bacterium]|nr:DUF4129 domain-containing protein [Pyrinomonadaceae bacterium]